MRFRSLAMPLLIGQIASALIVVGAPSAAAAVAPSEWVIGADSKMVVLTLEGQASGDRLQKMVSTLLTHHAKATFFTSGSYIAHHQTTTTAILASGSVLGNRGYGTELFTTLDSEHIQQSLTRAQTAIETAGGNGSTYFRPPKGARDLDVLQSAAAINFRSVRWTFQPAAGKPAAIRDRVLDNLRPGAIINLEVWRKSHRDALEGIIKGIKRRGYAFKTITALAHARPVRWDITLSSGSSGTQVKLLQKGLSEASYAATVHDGNFGYETLQGTYAYEKTKGLERDGVVPPSQLADILVARRPKVQDRWREDFIEIDISRQVLFEVHNGRVFQTIPVSTGNEEYYEVDGKTYKAHTPRGDFQIERKIRGERVSRLGVLWWPNYFYGGYAIHGSDSVPTYPASHGCVRIPMYLTENFYDRNPIGTSVFVHR